MHNQVTRKRWGRRSARGLPSGVTFASRPDLKMTARMVTVLKLRCEGMQFKAIADECGLSIKTVEYHWRRVCEQLRMTDLALLTQYAVSHGIAEWKLRGPNGVDGDSAKGKE